MQAQVHCFIALPPKRDVIRARCTRKQWGSGTWYPLDVAAGDETEHIIAQASVTTLSFASK